MDEEKIYLFSCLCCGGVFIHKTKLKDIRPTGKHYSVDTKCPMCGIEITYMVHKESEVKQDG